MDAPVNTSALAAGLPRDAARMLAVETLLAEPEILDDDVLESCLYILRERLRAADPPNAEPSCLDRPSPGNRPL